MYYNSINQFVKGAAGTVLAHGNKGSIGYWQGVDKYVNDPIREMANLYFVVPMHNNKKQLARDTLADMPWAEDHFQERINPANFDDALNPGRAYKWWPHANFKATGDDFKNQKEEDTEVLEKFSHTYMERFWPQGGDGVRFKMGNWSRFVENATKSPNSRQLYFPIFFPEDTEASHQGERVPCTIGYHFQKFGGRLHLSYFIRSCDLQKHFRNDVYFTVRLAQELKSAVPEYKHVPLGNLNMWVGNLHCFLNDEYKVKKWLKS